MILDVQPVAHVAAVAIDGQRLALERVEDHERDELLGELVRPVVVRAVREQRRKAVRLVPGAHEVVRGGLGRRVRRVRRVGRLLREEAGRSERAVDLVRRDMQEPERGALRRRKSGGERARGLEEDVRARHVRVDERAGAVDRAVDVRLGGEVQDGARPVRLEDRPHRGRVGDVGLDEDEAGVALAFGKAGAVAGVGQLVHDDDAGRGLLERVADEVRADETGAAGDEDRFHAAGRISESGETFAGARSFHGYDPLVDAQRCTPLPGSSGPASPGGSRPSLRRS